jgi:hypothetical protein
MSLQAVKRRSNIKNIFFEPAHLGRLKFFDFARIKREDLFEVVFVKNNKSRNARSKTKIRGYPNILGRYNLARQVLCLFLACSRKMAAQDFRLCEIKGIVKRGL